MERFSGAYLAPTLILSQPVYLPPNTGGIVVHRYALKTGTQIEGRPRVRLSSRGKESIDYYRSQPTNIGRRGKKVVAFRSVSEVRYLEREAGVRPLLILHNKPSMEGVGVQVLANNQSGTDAGFMNRDEMVQSVPAGSHLQKVSVRRTSTAGPNLQRVRDWLSDNDFTQDAGETPVTKTPNVHDSVTKQQKTERTVVDNFAVISHSNSLHQLPPPPPPPPPPPQPTVLSFPQKRNDSATKYHHGVDLYTTSQVVRSPDSVSKPKLLFSSEMAAAKRNQPKHQENKRKPSLTENSKAPTTPSEKNFENFVDSVFANALGSESDGRETPKTGRCFSSTSTFHGTCTSPPPGVSSNDGVDALLLELREKLKKKGLASDQLGEPEQENACAVDQDTFQTAMRMIETRNRVAQFDINSDVISQEFKPLDTSTPPPEPYNPFPVRLSAQTATSPTFSHPQMLSSTSVHSNATPFIGVNRTQNNHLLNVMYNSMQHSTSFSINVEDKPHLYKPSTNTMSPHQHSNLAWSPSSNTEIVSFEELNMQSSLSSTLPSSQTAFGLNHFNVTLQPLQQSERQVVEQSTDGFKQSPVTESQQVDDSRTRDFRPSSQFKYETNTAADAQTSKEFFSRNRSGVHFETEHNSVPRGWFVRSIEIPEQRVDQLPKDLQTGNNVLYYRDHGTSPRRFETEKIETDGRLPRWDQNNVSVLEDGSLFYNINKTAASTNQSLGSAVKSSENRTRNPEPYDVRLGGNYSRANQGLFSGPDSCNLWTSLGDRHIAEDYLVQAFDPNVPGDLVTDTQSVYRHKKYVPPSSPRRVEAELQTNDALALFPPYGDTHHVIESPQQLGEGTHLKYHHATTGDRSGLSAREFLNSGRLHFSQYDKLTFDDDVTPFRGESYSDTRVTWSAYNSHTCNGNDFLPLNELNDSQERLENVNLTYSDQAFDNFEECVYHSYVNGVVDTGGRRPSIKYCVSAGVSAVRFNNTVSELPSRYTVQGHVYSEQDIDHFNVIDGDNLSDNTDDDTPNWTSSSSSDSETNLQRFSSGAINQKTFNSIFAHGATVSLRARADRTLTGSHNNLLSTWLPHIDDSELDKKKGFVGQSRSAPSSSRNKKKNARTLSGKKILGKNFFEPSKSSDVWFEPKPTDRNNNDNCDNNGPASPTTISISSSSNGSKVVRIYQRNTENQIPPAEHITTNESTMLSNHNHDHELLPPSASNSSKKGKNANIYASSSLLRSKSMFTSTPSLFTRSSPEEKFWKKEIKKEKEEKKRLEEERKKLEKQSKKEEKKRTKSQKRASTLNAKNIPKDWNYRSGPVDQAYARHGFQMTAVPIEYTDNPPSSYQGQPPPYSEHYAIPSVVARGGMYANGTSPADMTRVEQVYGTTQRRPPSVHHANSHYATPYGYLPPREHHPRVVLLHRSPEGYGFVLRGAKSKLPTGGGFNDFTPTAEYPALQYLDSVDLGSQADRAGLMAGDFILEINGENVMRASHEHVVHLIRSSSDVLTLKVVTVTQADPTPSDWYAFQDYGAMTLPNRKKIAAPLPPQRDPQTSLSYSKASSKSMTEGLAEIEKLDAAIAEFEGQDEARSHSHQATDDYKVASVRASHALKRVSVMDYDGLITGEPGTAEVFGKGHASPAEARIKKYHKRSPSQTMERSKSTPDISAAKDQEYSENSSGGQVTGSWARSRAPPPQDSHYISGAAFVGTGPYSQKTGKPEISYKALSNHQVMSTVPPAPEIVRIHTTGKNTNYGNITAEIESRKMESPYESSFRPESTHNHLSTQNGDKYISFADERILENANKFVQKYPNATVLVTADIHSDKTVGSKDKVLYEPDPDYDDDDKSIYVKNGRQNNSPVVLKNSKQNMGMDDMRNVVPYSSNVLKQSKSSVTVISINGDATRENTKQASSSHSSPNLANSAKSSPISAHIQENITLTSPIQSSSSSRRSSGIVMATPSQPSSAGSSRRSSIQSNYSGDNADRNGRSYTPLSTSTIIVGNTRDNHQVEVPPPPPPPPPPVAGGKPSSREGSANSTLRLRQNDVEAITALQNRVSTDDILAAVADRRNRMENEGPRLSDVKSLRINKSTHELNQEALKAAVAARKSRLEQQSEDKSLVNEIEARLNRNKKLQAVKYYGSDTKRNSGAVNKEEEIPPLPVSVAASTASKVEEKPKDVRQVDLQNKPSAQIKLSPVVPIKSNPNIDSSLSGLKSTTTIGSPNPSKNISADFRAKLKPVDVKGNEFPMVVQSKKTVSSSPDVTTPGTNITTIVMTKGNPIKAQAPPPPPPLPSSAGPITAPSSAAKPKVELSTLATSKTGQKPVETKSISTNPLSPTSPQTNNTPCSADYIALAEKARQEYLKKKAAGTLQTNIEKKGPVEITPNKKNLQQRNKPTTPTSSVNVPPATLSKSSGQTVIEVKPNVQTNEDDVQISVQDRIKILQSDKGLSNGKTNVAGVTEDHSHTEISLSNGTIKKSSPKSNILSPLNITSGNSSGLGSRIAPPPPGFGDNDGNSTYKGVAIDIIPPPSSFSAAGSPDSALSVPSYGQDDAASFVSSVSSLSTLSSEHGDGGFHHGQVRENIKDLFAHSPPPPPDFGNSSLGDQNAFIPPPPEFLEIDTNANESKAMDKNSRPFASKSVLDWSCTDVLEWLDSLNLPQYRISFAKARVDGNKLVNMGRNEFIHLGVTQVAHRMNLERSVKKLNMGTSTNL